MIISLINLIKVTINFLKQPTTIAILAICIVAYYVRKYNIKRTADHIIQTDNSEISEESIKTNNIRVEYEKAYEFKYLMTLNEKYQFKKIQVWTQNNGMIVFTKVRLLDLITPRKGQDNYKALLWKIQAKHVDFVICDKDIRVKCIIEINDNSHKRADRSERDQFITDVLTACGYKVLQTYDVTDEQLDQLCNINQSTNQADNNSI